MMSRADSHTATRYAFGVANGMLLAAAAIAWAGIVIHMLMQLDLTVGGLGRSRNLAAAGAILLGICSGVANIGYYARTESLHRQWLLIALQIVSGLVALYLSQLITPAMMLIVSMAQVPARSGAAAISAVFAATNILLIGVLLTMPSTATDAFVVWFLFVGFQLFALTVAVAQQRERLARESLAAVNSELVATRSLVATSARAEERLRVSRELHDLAGHTLTAIKLRLEAHSRKAPDELRSDVLATRDMAQELLDDVRAVVSHLRQYDPVLFQDAIRGMSDRFPDASIHLSIDDEHRPHRPDEVHTMLRCIQEAVTNAIHHGKARNIWITYSQSDAAAKLLVRDDGVGGLDYEPGNGLRGIRERLASLGGQLEVRPSTSDGWTLEMRFPGRPAPLGEVAT